LRGTSTSRFTESRRGIFQPRYKRVPGVGPKPARLMLIGEKPGEREAERGLPFVGPTGELLDTLLAAANLDRQQIYITNLVKEFTGYTKPTKEEVERDLPELIQEMAEVKPEVVGLLGTYAVEYVLERERAEMDRTHGVPVQVGKIVYVPMYHPAAGLHGPESLPAILDDFLRLAQVLDGELRVREDKWLGREVYQTFTRPEPLVVKLDCAIDTEGWREKPWCMTVSTGGGMAWLLKPGQPVMIESEKVYLHNSLHDLGVLKAMGIELGEGQFRDTMVMAYHLCVEPQGLKALAYRHCGAVQADYADMVEEPGRDKALEYMLQVFNHGWPDPEPYMVLEKGLPKMYKPQNVTKLVGRAIGDLAADKRDKDGNPVDLRKRWGTWDDTVKKPVIETLGDMPVADLDDVDPEVAERYACRDADVTRRIGPILEERVREMGLVEAVRVDHELIPMIDRMQEVGIQLAPEEFWDKLDAECEAQMGRSKYEIYKMTGMEINPGSGDQVAELLYGVMKLVPPKWTDTGTRGAVDGLALESLLAEAPVVQPIMDYKEAQKIKGTYVEPLRALGRKGERAHSTMRLTRTTTGRLSMADPPLHQIPIMTELGKKVRGGFVAPEGRILGDWDLNQIEMRLMAHESQDPELCGAFIAGRDIHTETCMKIFSVSRSQLSTDDRGKVDDVRRTVAKHAGFGIINGITEHGLVNYMILNRCRRPDGEPWTLDDCEMLLREWFRIYKGVKRFQEACVVEAQETGLARESIAGKIVYLPAVWHPVKRIRESAERMSYVMHTQGGAASLMKKGMKRVWDWVCKDPELEVKPLLWVHDENLLEMPDKPEIREYVGAAVIEALTKAVTLRVPVLADGDFGQSWLEAH
jgi:uracil-DNA glycosylase family 4